MADVKNAPAPKTELEGSTYQIIQKRLKKQAALLQEQLNQLNESRKQVFGAVETRLVGTNRITTANNCIPKDMVSVGKQFLFGYNVHIGLRSEIRLEDVFSLYRFEAEDHSFHQQELSLLADKQFEEDFKNLYKYYKHTVFAKFALVGPHLFMVFQVGKGPGDVKTFKWALQEHSLSYLGNRFDHEYKFPDQHEFVWKRTNRDMHRRGKHPHISILDRVFVETVGGDLTIKVEDNTDSGQGIYAEEVTHKEQTLDDAEVAYADLGNLIVLRIRPYQEKTYRYFIFNEKMQEALRVDSLEHACVLLPDEQGLIFANGYYLQTGEYKIFDHAIQDLQFERRISSPNGEDFLYVFYNPHTGLYVLLQYNLVNQQVATPILCHGFSLFSNGELCYFRAEDQPGRHHTLQIWQTPYTRTEIRTQEHTDSYLFKIGNKDIVRAMAECNELLTLIHKGDTYTNLYIDLVQHTQSMLDSYYWIKHPEAGALGEPLQAIGQIAAAAIDEFEKVRRIRQHTEEAIQAATDRLEQLLHQIKRHKAKSIEQYVHHLAELRLLRGEIIGLKELRYANTEKIELLEQQVAGQTQKLSADCIQFLLKDTALAPYREQLLQHEAAIAKVEKVAQAREAAKAIDQTAGELELLIEVVSNLKIEDATETTRIIEQISDIYAGVNQLRARLKTRRKALLSQEATAEFQAQLKLLEQAVVNYLELCDSPPKCDEYLTKLMVQLEELEGKFTEFDEFADQLAQKREEIYQAFESRKLSLTEARNKRANNLLKAAERILKGIQNRLAAYEEVKQIHAYFASDLMVEKVRDIIAQLQALEDSVKAGDIQARLKSVKEDAIRQLKDKNELFVAGNNLIQFGRHHFSVNIQPLDLTLLPREGQMYVHLSGTNFFEQIDQPELEKTRAVWEQSLLSENQQVYRAEYLAWQMFQTGQFPQDTTLPGLQQSLRKFMVTRYQEGYTKGIHDADAARILHELIQLHARIDLLRYAPRARACASLYWHSLMGADEKQLMSSRLKGVGIILELFPDTREFGDLVTDLQEHIRMFTARSHLFEEGLALEAGEYLFFELSRGQHFIISLEAAELYQSFQAFLKKQKIKSKFDQSIAQLAHAPEERFDLIRSWLSAFTAQ
ncbi:MAG: AAA family ATPase, partial [Bacteroidetes bacterium]